MHSIGSKFNVSVAGCLGYDVLALPMASKVNCYVSVAGCLGYDVLVRFVVLIVITSS